MSSGSGRTTSWSCAGWAGGAVAEQRCADWAPVAEQRSDKWDEQIDQNPVSRNLAPTKIQMRVFAP